MKLMYGNVPVKSMNIHSYELSTNDATLKASDMQAGVTAYAKGQKVVGTGKCFEFAMYGSFRTNSGMYVPNEINVIEIASTEYPVISSIPFNMMGDIDFSNEQVVGQVNIDGSNVEIKARLENNILTLICSNSIYLEIFYGRDNYL